MSKMAILSDFSLNLKLAKKNFKLEKKTYKGEVLEIEIFTQKIFFVLKR